LNPSTDYADPYNTRSGNPYLQPYFADNFDLIFGKWNKKFNVNGSVGYNALQDIYSSIRTLQPDGKTFTTWQNISGRKEYEASAWGGYTLSKKAKANLSFGYTYNVYSQYDRTVRYFRNGGSFYSTLNGSYQFTDLMNANASFTFNRFANPQGTVRNTLSMNMGVQRKFFSKKFIVTFNVIDPFRQQQNKNFTYGSNFNLESFSTSNSRNYRIGLSYLFKKKPKKNQKLTPVSLNQNLLTIKKLLIILSLFTLMDRNQRSFLFRKPLRSLAQINKKTPLQYLSSGKRITRIVPVKRKP
jgi:hypothetical protein